MRNEELRGRRKRGDRNRKPLPPRSGGFLLALEVHVGVLDKLVDDDAEGANTYDTEHVNEFHTSVLLSLGLFVQKHACRRAQRERHAPDGVQPRPVDVFGDYSGQNDTAEHQFGNVEHEVARLLSQIHDE